jgi:hypothetical protein
MMECPKCKFEQPLSDICIDCGIIFSKYKIAEERKRTTKSNTRYFRRSAMPEESNQNDVTFYIVGALFIGILFLRIIYFLKFPPAMDHYFRLFALLVMSWLGFRIVPKMATLFNRLEGTSNKKYGLDGFELYKKKTIFIFFTLGAVLISFLTWSLLTGSIECFSGRNRTCHEIYNSIADPGEFWVTVLINYFFSLLIITSGYMGLQLRRNQQ